MANKKAKAPEHTKWKPGQSGNPGGKPVGARNKLQADFLRELAEDFEIHGKKAIQDCRANKPDVYFRGIVQLMPKQLEIEKPLESVNDADLAAAIALLQSVLAAQSVDAGAGETSSTPQTH